MLDWHSSHMPVVICVWVEAVVPRVGDTPLMERLRIAGRAIGLIIDRKEMGYSPDRVDALVWALTELMIEGDGERRFMVA
jgi:hypothetical protein